ncbi:hypothetical protein ACEWY4_017481 [Coilia grayii]|uniref:Ig-like domain-containing protein n=1 Tax=Coilia grayii TaxID=363190 RepID=A0ABD1JGZ3_9TELE
MLLGDLSGWSVSYTPESMCALEGSSVELHSYYSYPPGLTVQDTFWFISDSKNTDLKTNAHYAGRVTYTGNTSNHTLSIRGLNLGDSKGYAFRFTTKEEGGWSGVYVPLSVTGLQVLVDPATVNEGDRVTLTCSTTCSLSNNPTYIWYRNSQPVTNKHTAAGKTLTINSITNVDTGYYSCAVRGHEDHPSPAVCVWKCFGVAYNPNSMCALKGSSVELHSYYSYPPGLTVQETFWFIKDSKNTDLRKNAHYAGRVTYTESTSNHTLSIRSLNLGDSKDYAFRFITKEKGGWSGVFVPLSVTGLQVLVDPATVNEGDRVTLTCSATCSLSNNPTYIWYRNSQPVSNQHTGDYRLHIYPVSPEDAGKYSCALEGHESLISPENTLSVRYAPRNTSVSVSPPGGIKVGDSVTLTCSSDANPPVENYNWYSNASGSVSEWLQQEGIYNITNISVAHTGHYYCKAENKYGSSNFSTTYLDVQYSPRNTTVLVRPPGDIKEGDSVTLTCSSDANPPVENYTWYSNKFGSASEWLQQEGIYNITNITVAHTGHYYCKAENKYGSSNSSATYLDVQYSPRNTTVSISPSGDNQEGDSVTLTCSSDANPPVENYTWYKSDGNKTVLHRTERIPSFTLILVSGLDGLYHCEAGNEVGKENSTRVQVRFSLPDSGFYKIVLFPVLGAICAVVLLLVVLICWR